MTDNNRPLYSTDSNSPLYSPASHLALFGKPPWQQGNSPPDDSLRISLEEHRQMVHGSHVHEIQPEEMQNPELRSVQEKPDVFWARYFDLYDFAPGIRSGGLPDENHVHVRFSLRDLGNENLTQKSTGMLQCSGKMLKYNPSSEERDKWQK